MKTLVCEPHWLTGGLRRDYMLGSVCGQGVKARGKRLLRLD